MAWFRKSIVFWIFALKFFFSLSKCLSKDVQSVLCLFSKKIDTRKISNKAIISYKSSLMRLNQTFINSTTLALKQGLKFKFHWCSLHNKKITTYLHTYHKRNKTTWVSYHFHLFLFSISRHLWAVKNRVWKPTKKCCYDLSCFIEVKRGR